MFRSRLFLLPLLLAGLLIPIVTTAQGQSSISSLEIAIWPEYDRPAALVIYQVSLPENVVTPAVVTIPIPADAGEPHAVAAWYPDGALDDNVTWTANPQGDQMLIEVTTVTSGIWLEFYDEITVTGDKRSYEHTWASDFPVESLIFDVMHPVGAHDLLISPSGDEHSGSDGIPRTRLSLGSRDAGEAFSIELSYTKPSAFTGVLPTNQPNPAFTQFEVALWPEFDQRATLVIYRGSLSPEVSLPTAITLPIPASVGDPNAVAILGDDSRLYSADFERQVEGDWAWITFETESAAFQLEYYDDLAFEGTRRTYTHFWPGVLNTGSFTYELQQPVGATGLLVTPTGSLQAASDGLSYVRSSLGPQQDGSPLTISFQYEKTSTDLTVDTVTSPPTIDRPSTTQGGTPDLTAQLPFILGGFGLALIVLGIYLYLRMQRGEKASRKRPRQRKRKPKSQSMGGDLDAAAVFCHVCGSKASASDHFCRSCGTKLRQ
jgi:hypothetical protein